MDTFSSAWARFFQLSALRSGFSALLLFLFAMSSCSIHGIRGYYTPAEAYQNAGALAGRRIAIRGTVEIVAENCTEVECPPDNPCCNTCFYTLGFQLDARRAFFLSGAHSGCDGNSCRPECEAIEPGKIFQVTGTLKTYGGPDCYLELGGWTSMD
jgi:hypothetical protein